MMTSFVFVFAVAVLALANAETVDQKFERFHRECRSADAITPRILCMNVKTGVMKSNGDIDRTQLKAALKEIATFTNASIDDAVANCGESFGETAAEAALFLNRCLKLNLKWNVIKASAGNAMVKFKRIDKECESANAITPHVLCMMVKTGFMKPNGDIDRNDLKAALKEIPNFPSALVDVAVADCGERNGSTAAEAAEALNKCVTKLLNPASTSKYVRE